jgi:nicotinic acid mononucleotide adenylyltransferase
MILKYPKLDSLKANPNVLIVYMGSFSPFHISHGKLITDILSVIPHAKLIIAPVNDMYPKRRLIRGLDYNGNNYRVEMCKLAMDKLKGEFTQFDIEVSNHAFTSDLKLTDKYMVEHFKNSYPNHRIAYLVGQDVYDNFDNWDNENKNAVLDLSHDIIVHDRNDDISSSEIRNTYKMSNKLINLYDSIKDYIIENNLMH